MIHKISDKTINEWADNNPEWKSFKSELAITLELISFFSAKDVKAFSKYILWQLTFLKAINIPQKQFESLCWSIHDIDGSKISPTKNMKMFLEGGLNEQSINFPLQNNLVFAIVDFHSSLFGEIDQYVIENDANTIQNDANQHLAFLNQALEAESPLLFNEYISWYHSTLQAKGYETQSVIRFLVTMRIFLEEENNKALTFIDGGILKLKEIVVDQPNESSTFLSSEGSRQYLEFLLKGDRKGATDFIMDLADNGHSLKDIYINIFQSSQYEIGRLWEKNQVSVAQEHYCTATTQMIMSMLYPRLFSSKSINKSVVATCVGNELHEIGIRMISDFMEMDGWDTYYLGANTPTYAIIEAIEKYNADLLALSVTLTPHVTNANEIIREVKLAHPHIKVIVGGYPFLKDEKLWLKIGADGLAKSADEVNETALAIVNGK